MGTNLNPNFRRQVIFALLCAACLTASGSRNRNRDRSRPYPPPAPLFTLPPQAASCNDIIATISELNSNYFNINGKEFLALKARVLKDDLITERDFYLRIIDLMHNMLMNGDRLLDCSLYDGVFVERQFLRGITIWAENYEELSRAVQVFYHADLSPRFINPKAKLKDDLDLHYFAARMAYVVDAYDYQNKNIADPDKRREAALEETGKWDDTNDDELYLSFDEDTLRITRSKHSRKTLSRVSNWGFHLPEEPLSEYGLLFGNRNRFNTFYLNASEEYMAAQIASSFPDNWILGLGDLHVRQFGPLFRVENGRIIRFDRGADLLWLTVHSSQTSNFGFIVGEEKFIDPHFQPTEDVFTSSLAQMVATWKGLAERYKKIPVIGLQLVIPQPRTGRGADLGHGYSVGQLLENTPDGGTISRLMKDGKEVFAEVRGRTIYYQIYQLPIGDDVFKKMPRTKGKFWTDFYFRSFRPAPVADTPYTTPSDPAATSKILWTRSRIACGAN